MNTFRKLFGGLKMTWVKVLIFAIVAGVYTGLINQVPALKDTSFQDIAVSLEVWILFALIIVTNCKSPLEAALKCFVFFLVSQPIVYLVEMPMLGYFPWDYYKYWLMLTILTFPGGALAYFVKKKNIFGTIVLSLANCLLVAMGVTYVKQMMSAFPHHLLSAIFCFGIAILFVLIFQTGKKERVLGFSIIVVAALASIIFLFGLIKGVGGADATYSLSLPDNTEWTCVMEDSSLGEASMTGSTEVTISMHKKGSTKLICTDADGNQIIYDVSEDSNNVIQCVPEE